VILLQQLLGGLRAVVNICCKFDTAITFVSQYQYLMPKSLRPAMIITSLLRPLMRFCLKRGVRIQELEELVRGTLVEEARAVIEDAQGEASVSKISVTTGIHRVEVARLLSGERRPKEKHDVLNRVIGLWSQKKSLHLADGSPKPLTFEGAASEFAALVASISKEVTHYPILFELERLEAIEYDGNKVRLKVLEYIPSGDVEHGLSVLSDDVEDLVRTVEGNLTTSAHDPDLHLRTAYDNIAVDKLPEVRRFILERGAAFQKEMRSYLSALDRDVTPEAPGSSSRAKVVVGAFSQACALEEPKELKPKKRGRKPCAPRTK
jgi:hypothetical protein